MKKKLWLFFDVGQKFRLGKPSKSWKPPLPPLRRSILKWSAICSKNTTKPQGKKLKRFNWNWDLESSVHSSFLLVLTWKYSQRRCERICAFFSIRWWRHCDFFSHRQIGLLIISLENSSRIFFAWLELPYPVKDTRSTIITPCSTSRSPLKNFGCCGHGFESQHNLILGQ